MKRILLYLFIFITVVQSCSPDDFKSVGTPLNPIAALTGNWQLVKVTQTDADAAKKGFPYQTMDITSVFPYTDFKLTLNSSAGAPSTFTTTPGNAPRIISLATGNWTVDNNDAPKLITFVNGTTTNKITLGSYPTALSPTLKIRVERRDAGTDKLLITYDYEFAKQ
jgi:hypothetical protein